MPAGLPYFAWIDAGETTFETAHLRWDEQVFSFSLAQEEGDPASLTVVVRRPRNVDGDPIGLLGPGRKIWIWFALDCGGSSLIKFRGRLVGIPTSIFEELVTLEFIARPIDLVVQKEALAATLRVLPYYDEVVIDERRRSDPEVVLEGYSAIWHYDRETHVVTISDEITGEDGLVEFDGASEAGKVLYDGLALTLTSGPLARVDIIAEYTWTQLAEGNVDLTKYLIRNWPGAGRNYVTSYSMTAANWPKPGAGIGDGWVVADSTAQAVYDQVVKSVVTGGGAKTIFPDTSWFGPSTQTANWSDTQATVAVAGGSIPFPEMVTNFSYGSTTTFAEPSSFESTGSSLSWSFSAVAAVLPLNQSVVMLRAGFAAKRQMTEVVTLSLLADVQHVLTDPEDGEALRIDDIKSVNLSEPIGAEMPIGDPRRRSYIATERGNGSVEHLIALARAHLLRRARVVEIAFAPKLARMPEITLRKNGFLIEPRVGEALGKIVGYSVALDGSDGRIRCEVRIGCAIGYGGSAVAAGGEPTYCEVEYTGADYQQFTGRMVLFDASVGYAPPNMEPNDDGINFLSAIAAEDVIETGLVVENPASVQLDYIRSHALWAAAPMEFSTPVQMQESVTARATAINNALKECETRVTFKLKSMTREFSTDYDLQVTDLNIPTGYDLEVV